MTSSQPLRSIPSVEQLLSSGSFDQQIAELSRPLVTRVIREILQVVRDTSQTSGEIPSIERIGEIIVERLHLLSRQRITPVINGTGVLIHTNLGRAPLGAEFLEQVAKRVSGYCTLEFDLTTGKRGERGTFLSYLLAQLTEAEAALAVNNNAAALFLILNTFANRKEVIVSRGELVQIGGGFRIPDIIRRAGAKLVEVGTTNRTTKKDYEEAITKKTALLLKVHQSNFRLQGFVEEVSAADIATLAAGRGLISVYGLGSGVYHQTENYGMEPEPNITAAKRSGASVVCFSGDKFLGSVQAGIVLGSASLLDKLHKNPIYRVLRLDKLSIAMLEETTFAYLKKEETGLLPLWRYITLPVSELRRRAERIKDSLAGSGLEVGICDTFATPGGGSLPGGTLASVAIAVVPKNKITAFASQLLQATPPLIGYIDQERFFIDLRTVDEAQDDLVIRILTEAAACTR
ncbi:MAG: L-seryl-tRNA(Sec) selenium transferase [candidate division Zixibacteria bacterium]|nr:L-seryl-tRNA(Sec) selenium transferase [candidate division Zixibacteria bacterium]